MRASPRFLAVAALFAASTVAAQGSPPREDFSVLRFRPAPGPRNFLEVERAAVPGHLTGSAGLVLDYAHRPFTLFDAQCDAEGRNCTVGEPAAELVSYLAVAHVYASFQLFDRLLIGAVVPVALSGGASFRYTTPDDQPVELLGGDTLGVGDPRVHLKGLLWQDAESGLSLGVSGFVTLPVGQAFSSSNAPRWLGDPTLTAGGSAILDFQRGGLRAAVNAGGVWREEAALFSTVVGPQVTYGVAAGYVLTPLFDVFGELVGASTFTDQADEHSLEWRVGARLRLGDFDIFLAGGTGLGRGVGTPVFRALGGLLWAPVRADQDGDGVLDEDDSCPMEAEDVDGWFDTDGCPESDNDEDGLLDGDDPCPNEAEDRDGHEDEDGCPDLDDDGDGVQDGYDSCPNEAEDMDGDRDDDGCPDNDLDGDGIEDPFDQCLDQPEDFDGYGDEDGCADVDFDEDGLPDEEEVCPDQPEDFDGVEDGDGCPE